MTPKMTWLQIIEFWIVSMVDKMTVYSNKDAPTAAASLGKTSRVQQLRPH